MAEKKAEVPTNRCGFELQLDDIGFAGSRSWWVKETNPVCCWRPVWESHDDTERCIWHADVDEKSLGELITERSDTPERLDGAILRNLHIEGETLSFGGCTLHGARFDNSRLLDIDFVNADLRQADFSDTDLHEVNFIDADLRQANFSDAYLLGINFTDAFLQGTTFTDADIPMAPFIDDDLEVTTFTDADLQRADFTNAHLVVVDFTDADLRGTYFIDASLPMINFTNADLRQTTFINANLRRTDFTDADLDDADLSDADAEEANFRHANLQDAVLARTDCREATFTSALLYETVFSDTRINSKTTFLDPDTTFYDSITSRPGCVYEENTLMINNSPDDVYPVDLLPKDVQPLEAARWVYRRLETLHEENALTGEAREFHISKEEAERALYSNQGKYRRWGIKTLMWYVTKHGESVKRVLSWWGIVIVTGGLLFAGLGGVKNGNGTHYAITSPAELGAIAGWQEVLWNLYFSITTFSTIMDGGLAPVGPWTRVVVAVESIIGALLVALLVFVLGRRVAR